MARKLAYRNLPQLFLRAREELLCHFRPIITHFGLTEQQWRVLRVIHEHDAIEPRDICEICQILSPSLTGVLARMEDMGLVTRTRMQEDQRRMLVRLTPKADKLVAELGPLIVAQYKILEQDLGPELIQELYDVVDKVINRKKSVVEHVKLPKRKAE